jgi:hypothetical protein
VVVLLGEKEMIAACQICGQLLAGKSIVTELPVSEKARAALDLQQFDLLAAEVAKHLMIHHRDQAYELTAFTNLAGKVYAMTQVESSEENFDLMRASWRAGIMRALFPQMYEEDAAVPAESGE